MLIVAIISTKIAGEEDLIVNTDKGKVKGLRYNLLENRTVDAFLGIPFAKPPIGPLRFKYPEPIDKWTEVYEATKLPSSCYQSYDEFFGDFEGSDMWNPNTRLSEDCLYLNVWVPKYNEREQNLDVLVWIYGGAFTSGTSTLDLYDGKILAVTGNVIVVSMQYRVGALGFMTLDDPSAPGNAGMLDQVMALEWVKKNIHNFGGNPKSITLVGESAGAISVGLHLLSPLSEDLFERAILQSCGGTFREGSISMKEGKIRTMQLAKILGCTSSSVGDILSCLREKPAEEIVSSQHYDFSSLIPFPPVIDGSFLTAEPAVIMKNNQFKKCPILTGTTKNEGSYFLIYALSEYLKLDSYTMNKHQFENSLKMLIQYYPKHPLSIKPHVFEAIRYQYTNWEDQDDELKNIANLDKLYGMLFHSDVNKFANFYASAGENVFMYHFTQRYKNHPWPSWMGVMHADEINMMFGEPFKVENDYTALEEDLSLHMMKYWTNFAKMGDPNKFPDDEDPDEQLTMWPLHTASGKEYLELNSKYINLGQNNTEAIGRGPRIAETVFWNEYLPKLSKVSTETCNGCIKLKYSELIAVFIIMFILNKLFI